MLGRTANAEEAPPRTLGEKTRLYKVTATLSVSFKCSACAAGPVVSGADGNALNFVVVSAVPAESFMHVA